MDLSVVLVRVLNGDAVPGMIPVRTANAKAA
jgi:hypothetical protein